MRCISTTILLKIVIEVLKSVKTCLNHKEIITFYQILNVLYNWPSHLITSKPPVPLNAAFEYMVQRSFYDLYFSHA